MKYLNLKRFVERDLLGIFINDFSIEELEEKVTGFWHIVAECFTA